MNQNFSDIPFDDIVKFGQRSLLYRDMFTVSWLLGRACNYHCEYCWPYARSDTKDHRPTEVCINTIDSIKTQARNRNFNSFHFSFSGGEPTIHRGYLDILKHYANDTINCNYQSVHMTSNCSPGLRWFEKYIDATKNLNRVSVTASWHRKGWKRNNDPSEQDIKNHMIKFADKLCYLQENDVQVTINIVMVPEWWDVLYSEAKYFNSRNINVTLKPQSDPTASFVVHGYTEEMKKILHNDMPQRDYVSEKRKWIHPKPNVNLKELGFAKGDSRETPQTLQVELQDKDGNKHYLDQAERFNSFGFNKFEGWTCQAGYRSIIIHEPSGYIKRSYSCHDKPLGHIETGFELFNKPSKCITKSCVSSADSKIPKWK